jgi:hypothetical protein
MPTLWAPRATFDNIRPGDAFPILIKFVPPSLPRGSASLNPDTLIASYVSELLQKGLPAERVKASADAVKVEITDTFTTQDILSLTGKVTEKDSAKRAVAYAIDVTTQENRVVARAQGEVTF